jgi:AraC family transcriptional regulator
VHVLPAGVPHAVRWDEPVESLVVEISAHFAAEVAVAEPSRARVELRPATGTQDRFVAHASLALAEEVEGGSPGGRLCGESLAGALVLRLLGTHGQLRPRLRSAERLSRPLLARVLGHAGDHIDQDLSLKELAAVAQMDVFRFVRAFKETLGVPPHQYLVRARIDRARSLLGSSARPISEVALATGFATPSHFATTFRRVTGMTPRTYRRSLR